MCHNATRRGRVAAHEGGDTVESVASKIQETGHHVAKKGDALISRTREAGEAFFGEVRDAGRELVVFVKGEAKGWRRFLTQRTSLFEHDARDLFAPKALERQILTQVDGALRTIDAKVRERLVALEKRPTRRGANGAAKRGANGAAKRGARKGRAGAPAAKTAANGTAPSIRH
jgi:hypothetical protein